jgi:predicted AlkP superfamily phosphohydrolase/phosphomutase
MTNRPTRRRLLLLAVDAGEISFVRRSLAALPTFRRLLDEGVFFPLRSSAEYVSASVWPGMYSGLSPGEHGISQHIQWDPDAMRLRRIDADWVYCEPFWYGLARAGLRVAAVDVPFAFANREPRAVEIANWGSHDLVGRFDATTPELRRAVRRRFGRHPMGYEIPVRKDARQLAAMRDELVAGARRKGELVRWLHESASWDFFLAVFGECHRGGHILWRDPVPAHAHVPEGALLDVYRAVDGALGEVLAGVGEETTVIVFALHGMGPNHGQDHLVRRVLDRFHAGERSAAAPRGAFVRALRERVPARLQHAVARAVPVGVRDWVVAREMTGGIDWRRTPAFALRADLHGFLRLNLVGRERRGALAPESTETARYVEHLLAAFAALRTPDGAPVVRDVVASRERLPGARSRLLPDLILRWADQYPATRVESPTLGTLVAEPELGRTGEHRTRGFAVVRGPGLAAGLPPLNHNQDFPAFVRHLVGVPGA